MLVGNLEWFQANMDTMLNILPLNISDHALLHVTNNCKVRKSKKYFKFNNCLVDLEGYEEVVKGSWEIPARGRPMQVLWHKLQRLEKCLREFNKRLSQVKENILKSREDLRRAQLELMNNKMDQHNIERVNKCTEDVIMYNDIEEKMLMQRAKIEWLRKGDGNNSYFSASIKTRQNNNNMKGIQNPDGTPLNSQQEVEKEVMDFYSQLMGKEDYSC